jgi:hypothetical protein
MREDYVGVGGAGAEVGYSARRLADDFYAGRLDASRCLFVAGRRLIPRTMIPEIRRYVEQLKEKRRKAETVGTAE